MNGRPNNEIVAAYYGERCTKIYKEVMDFKALCKALPDEQPPGIKHWRTEDGTKTLEYDPSCKVYTYTYTGNDQDRKEGKTGTNGKLVVKLLEEGSYDNVKIEDLTNHGLLLIKSILHSHILDQIPEEKRGEFKEAIKKSENKFRGGVPSIDLERMKKIIKENKDDEESDIWDNEKEKKNKRYYYQGKAEQMEKITLDLYRDLHSIYNQYTPSHLDAKEFKALMVKAKMQVIKDEGRPNIVKFSEFENGTFMSAQFTGSTEQTRPSLDRWPSPINAVHSSNHVLEINGVVEKIDGESKVIADSPLTGNSSPTGLFEGDQILRRLEALRAIKEQIAKLALDSQKAGCKAPIKIDLSVMILLSSYKGAVIPHLFEKKINEKSNYFNERFQLQDLRWAYEVIRDQKKLNVSIDGKTLPVEVNVSYMTLPANKAGKKIKYEAASKIEERINCKGFYEYGRNIENFILGNFRTMEDSKLKEDKLKEDLHGYITGSGRDIEKLEKRLLAIKSGNTERLSKTSIDIEALSVEYSKEADPKKREKLKNKWKDLKDQRKEMLREENDIYEEIVSAQKTAFAKNKDKINSLVEGLEDKIKLTKDPKEKEFLLLSKEYLSNVILFHTKAYKTVEHNYHFQCQYLLSNEKIGRFIQSYCKSGKDRTGWIRILRSAYLMFNRVRGTDPDVKKDQDDFFKKTILPFAYQSSVSIESTVYNSGGRGLEVSDKLTNQYAGVNLGKTSATLVKKVMAKAAEIGPQPKEDITQAAPYAVYQPPLTPPASPRVDNGLPPPVRVEPDIVPPRQARDQNAHTYIGNMLQYLNTAILQYEQFFPANQNQLVLEAKDVRQALEAYGEAFAMNRVPPKDFTLQPNETDGLKLEMKLEIPFVMKEAERHAVNLLRTIVIDSRDSIEKMLLDHIKEYKKNQGIKDGEEVVYHESKKTGDIFLLDVRKDSKYAVPEQISLLYDLYNHLAIDNLEAVIDHRMLDEKGQRGLLGYSVGQIIERVSEAKKWEAVQSTDTHQIPLQEGEGPVVADGKPTPPPLLRRVFTSLTTTLTNRLSKLPQLTAGGRQPDKSRSAILLYEQVGAERPLVSPAIPVGQALLVTDDELENLRNASVPQQFERDARVLSAFLSGEDTSDGAYAERQMILRRVLCAIDLAGPALTLSAQNDIAENESTKELPIASVLLHGDIFKIEVPYVAGENPDAFFDAIIGGKKNIAAWNDLGKNSGQYAMGIGAPVFHHPSASVATERCYGMNLGLGGRDTPLPADGHHGYLYMHWTPPSDTHNGALVVSIRGSEPGLTNRFGEVQTEKDKDKPNEFSASGGLKFTHPIFEKFKQFGKILQGKIQPDEIHKIKDNNYVMGIDEKIRQQAPLEVTVLPNKTISLSNKDVSNIEAELHRRKDIIHSLSGRVLTKQQSEELIHHADKCKKLLQTLEGHKKTDEALPGNLEELKIELKKLAGAKGKIAAYHGKENLELKTKELNSTYIKGEEEIKVTQLIKMKEGQVTSELTSSPYAIKTLAQEYGNHGSKIMVLNEAIKWIEETLRAAYEKGTPLKDRHLTLMNYDALDKKFLRNIVLYCSMKGYPCAFIPPSRNLTSHDKKEIKEFSDFYKKYDKVLYQAEAEEKLALAQKPPSLPTLMAGKGIPENNEVPHGEEDHHEHHR